MKIKIIFLAIMFIFFAACSSNTLTIEYSFAGIEEGYDHQTKTIVYVDGQKVAESDVHKQSEPKKIEFDIDPGMYVIRVVNYAFYEGKWEEHTTENGYSIDCIFEDTVSTTFTKLIKILFDLDKGMSYELGK